MACIYTEYGIPISIGVNQTGILLHRLLWVYVIHQDDNRNVQTRRWKRLFKVPNKETGHPISLNDIPILASGISQFHVQTRESLLISKIKPSLDNNFESLPLTLF